ncbi:POTRA domain-containing protein [Thermovibrio sp.]
MKRLALLLFSFFILLTGSSPAAVIEKIEIYGLKWTKEKFVRRELLIKEGQEFSPKALSLSIRNLLNTHLFYRVKASVTQEEGKVVVKLYLKEKFPIVPLPRVRFKEDGSYKAGLEVRDYNLLGMGHRLYTGYTRWLNTEEPSKKAFIYLNLYRVIGERGDLSFGAYYNESRENLIGGGREIGKYTEKRYTFPVAVKLYLDRKKVNQISFGITPHISLPTELLKDRRLYYLNLYYTKDRSTDMVYYTVGRKFTVGGSLAIPQISSVFTGNLNFSYLYSKKRGELKTLCYRLFAGTKVGYSGKGYYLSSPIPGFKPERRVERRYVATNISYRFPIIDKSVFLKSSFWLGDSFKNRPDDLLLSAGVELTTFWVKLADGIIRFKVFRGLGREADTQSSFRFSFRW